jgi:hypothetical protein
MVSQLLQPQGSSVTPPESSGRSGEKKTSLTNRNVYQSKRSSFHVNAFAGGVIALWKSVVITGKVEIGGAAAQMELRGVADKRMLYYRHSHLYLGHHGPH